MTNDKLELIPIDFNPFSEVSIQTVVTTEPQEEIFIACKLGGEDASRAFNETIVLELSGPFNQEAMYRALDEIVQRHQALRATFSADGKEMLINEDMPLAFVYKDLELEATAGQELEQCLTQCSTTSFDLLNGPLFKTIIVRQSNEVHHLIISAHHIVCDGWSFGVILEELSQLYSLYSGAAVAPLPSAPLFATFADEQSHFHQSTERKITEQYWFDLYKNSVPDLNLPIDFARPTVRTYAATRADFPLDKELVNGLKKIGSGAGCSFTNTLLAAFELFIHRLSNQDDITIGLPSAAQSATEYYGLVGHCVNLLPLRSKLNKDTAFTAFLQARKTHFLDAYDHQFFTFSSLLQHLRIDRNPSKIPLVPVIFNVDAGMDSKVQFNGLSYRLRSVPRAYENFELFLNLNSTGSNYTLEWSYNTGLFKASTIGGMMEDFKCLLETIIANPSKDVHSIPVHSAKRSVLFPWNNTKVAYPHETGVHHLISVVASRFPKNIAVDDGIHSITYEELELRSNQLAHYLQQKGIKGGDIVGLALDRSATVLIPLLAILKSGATYLPLDPAYPKDRIEFMLEDSSAAMLITSKGYKNQFKTRAGEIILEEIMSSPGQSEFYKPAALQGNDIAYLLYTSGSTGKPKGVLINHHNLVNVLYSVQKTFNTTDKDKFLGVSSMSFDISGIDFYLPLLCGASLYMADNESTKDPRVLLDKIKAVRPTFMQATPSTWQMLLQAGWKKETYIETICSTGEALSKDLSDQLLPCCTHLFNMYGPTETTIWSAVKKVMAEDELITIGMPIANTQIYILDERLRPVPENAIGEIYIGGDGVAQGYLNRNDLTREKFIADPFAQAKGKMLYATGDLGRVLPNHEIQCLGRKDQQVKIRGYRIEPEEVESAIVQATNIKQAVVMAREDQPGNKRLVAYLVTDQNLDGQAIINQCRQALKETLPSYMLPNDFVLVQNLPLTPNGKIDKKVLPAPEQAGQVKTTDAGTALTKEEAFVLQIWQEVLQTKNIGLDDDFFELGGHSMTAVHMITKVEKETAVRLPLAILVEHSSVRALASFLEHHKG
ncbi:MAG TPA: amino acid adenylation domain-containing protein [Chitinophagaceae bacterium]|nr:amino acid adenylation domain-containing protein [Chitinophagaceae bacterium]